MELPKAWVQEGTELAKEMRVFGIPFEEIQTVEELRAVAAHGWASYHKHMESSIRSMQLMRDLKRA